MSEYIVYKDTRNEYRWHLKSSNGRIIADSAQGYSNLEDCLRGIEIVKQSTNSTIYRTW